MLKKDKQKAICPNCKGNPILEELVEGFTVCGLCKGERSVYVKDESYHENRYGFLGLKRYWTDVVRIIAIERKVSKKMLSDLEKVAEYNHTKFLGFPPYYTTIIQNDINSGVE